MSEGQERKSEKEAPQLEPQQAPPSSNLPRTRRIRWRRLVRRASAALVMIATGAGLILFVDWAVDQYDLLTPEILPDPAETSALSSSFLLFSIHNRSKFADFYHVEVGCNFHVQVFGNEKYKVIIEGKAVDPGFDPKERDVTIERGESATFPCDPTMEPVPLTFNYDVLRNLSAELYLTVKYSVRATFFDWVRTYRSPTFHCVNPGSGLRCTAAETVHPDLPIIPHRN